MEVRYGNVKVCPIGERTKGPVGPVVKRIDQVYTIALCFESGGGYNSTIFGSDFEEGTLPELGIDNLQEYLVNCDRSKRKVLLTPETKPLKPGSSSTLRGSLDILNLLVGWLCSAWCRCKRMRH